MSDSYPTLLTRMSRSASIASAVVIPFGFRRSAASMRPINNGQRAHRAPHKLAITKTETISKPEFTATRWRGRRGRDGGRTFDEALVHREGEARPGAAAATFSLTTLIEQSDSSSVGYMEAVCVVVLKTDAASFSPAAVTPSRGRPARLTCVAAGQRERPAVRKTPSWPRSWPRSWAKFSLLQLYSRRSAWANWHLLGQPNTCLARCASSLAALNWQAGLDPRPSTATTVSLCLTILLLSYSCMEGCMVG